MTDIKKLLKEYRKNCSRLEILKLERIRLIKQLKQIPDEVKYCNNTSLLKWEPPNYKISRLTEEAGIKSSENHQKAQKKLEIIEPEIEELEIKVKTTEALLNSLSDIEKDIIQKLFVFEWRWCAVLNTLHLSDRTLQTIKKTALEKIESLLKL